MTTALNATVLTLTDWAKRLGPDGKIATIVEMLTQTNEILTDMLWQEGNLPTGHRTTVRTGLPTVAWRLINKGTATSKSTTAQIDEQCGMLSARSQVDVKLAKLAKDLAAFRLSEAQPFVEAMNQEFAQTLFYGNSGLAPEEFTGLSVRYSSLSAVNAQNIVSGGGSGSDNSSIWLVTWGENTIQGIFPGGSQAGLKHQDLGEADAFDADNNRFRAYMDLWEWDCGIALKDWRYVVRIPNIDISNLIAKTTAADVRELMIKAVHRIPYKGMGKPVFYMNRTVLEMMDIQGRDDVQAGGGLTVQNVDGVPVYSFRGIPVRVCDALLETEAAVS